MEIFYNIDYALCNLRMEIHTSIADFQSIALKKQLNILTILFKRDYVISTHINYSHAKSKIF